MKVQLVPVEYVNMTWSRVEAFIASALAHSKGDYTVEQAKTFVSQGVWQLLVAVDDDHEIKGAAAVQFYNRPNDRVAFIVAMGGHLISSPETFEQLKTHAASMGATVIEGTARESTARLWSKYGFGEKHRIVGVRI